MPRGPLRRRAESGSGRWSHLPFVPRGRGMRWLLVVCVCAVLAVAGVLVAWFSPAMSVRTIEIDGLDRVPRGEVIDALGIGMGTPLLQVDASAAAHRVAGIPRVARVGVHRDFPSTVRVDVTERVPVAFVDDGDGPRLLDASGVEFAREDPPPGLPQLHAPNPADPQLTAAVLGVLAGLPDDLRGQVVAVTADSPADIVFMLTDDRTLQWGSVDRTDVKARVALAILQQPGSDYDVSSPDLPTVG